MRLILLFVLGFIALAQGQYLRGSRATDAMNALLKGYDKRVPPENKIDVAVSAYAIKQYGYCERNSQFKMDMYFRQAWTDSRLKRSGLGSDQITGNEELRQELWTPDTFFANDNGGEIGKVMTPNIFVRVNASGEVFMSQRVTVTVVCNPDISHFPRDVHECKLDVESYAYDNVAITYQWKKIAKPFSVGQNLSDFTLLSLKSTEESITLSSGTYSKLVVTFVYQRNAGSYIVRDLLPSLIATIVSMVPLFISKRSPQFRVLLSALLLASNTVLMTPQIVQKASPRRGALTTTDCYITTNMFFVTAQFLLISYVTIKSAQGIKGNDVEKIAVVTETSESVSRINRLGRMAIVGLYAAFNVVYWVSLAM